MESGSQGLGSVLESEGYDFEGSDETLSDIDGSGS
jgi:hypothetical protein